jgi:hypothetical protein
VKSKADMGVVAGVIVGRRMKASGAGRRGPGTTASPGAAGSETERESSRTGTRATHLKSAGLRLCFFNSM